MREQAIIRVALRLLFPLILLFALYVQFHGELGPGGGFQAGVIFATAFILYGLVHGTQALLRLLPLRALEVMTASGLLIYGGTGLLTLLRGGNFLDYRMLGADAVHAQELGIFVVELGVGLTVAAVMTLIFIAFAHQGEQK
jgi:multicomponent Na+:H+ antiporter subunit B